MDKPGDVPAVNTDALTAEGLIDPSSPMNDGDEDEDWVIVKKQRITVLIPPTSPASLQSGSPKVSRKQTELRRSTKRLHTERRKHLKHSTGTKIRTVSDTVVENSGDVNNKSERSLGSPSEGRVGKDFAKMKQERSSDSPVAHTTIQKPLHEHSAKAASASRQSDKPMMPIVHSNVANRVMRARLLKKQLARFGGLRNWLLSCGLGRFVRTLERQSLGMYQLAGLTMSQLKDMGYAAVGPRRKLLHAIDNLCNPYYSAMLLKSDTIS